MLVKSIRIKRSKTFIKLSIYLTQPIRALMYNKKISELSILILVHSSSSQGRVTKEEITVELRAWIAIGQSQKISSRTMDSSTITANS